MPVDRRWPLRHRYPLLSGLAIAFCSCGAEDTGAPGRSVEVVDAYVVAPAGDAPAAMYVALFNGGARADTLVSIETDGAGAAEIHESMQMQGMVHMMAVSSLEIPPHDTIRMVPGRVHVMLVGTSRTLVAGDSVAATLNLRRGGSRPILVPVISQAAANRAAEALLDERR